MYRIGQEEIDAVARAINEKSLFKINDKLQLVKNVDEALCRIFGAEYAIFMTSGHAALTSALVGMGIGPGDEVIVPAYTYISTAMAVVAAGAIPVIAEADETLTLSPKDFEAKITSRTKAVIPVHIQGFPCRMDEIMRIAQEHGIRVLEDACQADGGSFGGRRLGTIGDAGALSFNYYKIITCGEGGALLTNNRDLFENALIYHDSSAIAYFGNQMEDFHAEQFCGSEYRANEISAAVLGVQLTRMDGILADNRRNKKSLMEKIAPYVTFAPLNDAEGDCATTLALRFDSEEEARRFAGAPGVRGGLPIDTGKHVYKNWTPIMQKRGALHPLMDPFKFEANRDSVPDYQADMCPATLDILSRTVYIGINPSWTEADIQAKADALISAAK